MGRVTFLKNGLRMPCGGLFVGLLAYLVLLFLIPFLGYGWHLLHGSYISYAGWKIPVPRIYFATKEIEGPALWRLSLGMPTFEAPYAHVNFFSSPHQFKTATDYAKFEGSLTKQAKECGYQFKGKSIVPTANTSAYCIEFSRQSKEPRSLVRCAVENMGIYAFYEGDSRYVPDLLNILRQMSLETSQNRPNVGSA
jgi:hypothetical protein